MKITEILPELPGVLQYQQKLTDLSNIVDLMKASSDGSPEKYRVPSLGLDHVVNQWVRQQMAYRMNLVQDLFTIAMTVEEIRAPINHIIGEVFRRGIQWKPKFAAKCEACQVEFQDYLQVCSTCRGELREPDFTQRTNLENFKADSNIFDQSLEEVLRQFWFDVNAIDIGWLYISKEYIEDGPSGVRSKPLEIRRIHPSLIEYDLDTNGLPKNSHWLCQIHRMEVHTESGDCPDCGRTLVPAMYKMYRYGGSANSTQSNMAVEGKNLTYLLDSEVIACRKFYTDELYGWSPIMTILDKALTLVGMDKNLYRYFWERNMPASMIMVFTDDPESMRREREHIASRMRQDPNYIPMVAVSTRQNRGRVEMVRLFHTLQEMDYLPVRNEIRERISSLWGVTPAWQGAPEAFGGLSSNTQQLAVMSRVVEHDQRLLEEKVFPNILEAFGVTDWVFELPSPEEKAEATKISFAQQRVSVANMLFQMGFDVKSRSSGVSVDDIDFLVSGEAKPPDQMGGMGGMMGGMMGGGEMPPEMGGGQEQGGEEDIPSTPTLDSLGLQLMRKSTGTWHEQILNKGYFAPIIKQVSEDGKTVIFNSADDDYEATFINGSLMHIEKYLHTHDGHPPHDENIKHNLSANRKSKVETSMYAPEEGEDIDDNELYDI